MSITERPVSPALKSMLVNNEPFQYAHLIKFERPSRPDSLSGLVSTAKERYTYLTDASINVSFDDGSKDLNGTANGTQVYLANKVLSVGAIQEQTKATTSNTSLVLDGNGLGADITANASIAVATIDPLTTLPIEWDITFSAPISLDDLLAEGFREGDKITVLNGVNPGAEGNGVSVNIVSFRANNVIRVKKIDSGLVTSSAISTRFKLASEEIISILLNKNSPEYSSFINREVFIYKAYFQNGVIVGTPICIFKGIINGVSFEDSDTSIRVTWGLSSHWSDFSQVKGRVTSDSAHRALDANGMPQVASALKPIYAYDKGFIHGETSINILAKYSVQVEKQETKIKRGFLGLFPKVKIKKSLVNEDRFTDLDLQIQAKSIPVIYGVRKAEPIPIFADTLKNNSAEVYVAFVLCEGEIGGLYDVYIEGNSLICNDVADFDARASQNSDKTVEVICRGRSDRGDVLGGVSSVATTSYDYFNEAGERVSVSNPDTGNYPGSWRSSNYVPPTANTTFNNYGIIDGESISLTSPSNMTLDVFTGKSGQKASALLSKIAYDKNFKIQESYWTGSDTYEYWGPNHRLIDTAYLVGKFIISEGDTTIPELSFIVRGKVIDCYNYDYSYLHDEKASSESHTNFSLGDTVTIWRSDTNTQINAGVQIIDKWTFFNPDGTLNVRFRFSTPPALIYDADGKPTTIKKFYMKSASDATWTMVTYNYNIFGSEYADVANRSFIQEAIASPITGTTNSSGTLGITFATNPVMVTNGDQQQRSALFSVVEVNDENPAILDRVPDRQTFTTAIVAGPVTTTNIVTDLPFTDYAPEINNIVNTTPAYLASNNTARLASNASTVNNFYKGYLLEITRYSSVTGKSLIQVGEIVGYDGTNKVATIDGIWDFIPTTTDTVRIYPKYADGRVSTNPAIQTLDYITSPSYGKGLDIYKDLDLPSWLDTARKCDTRSDITVLISSGAPVIGDVYRYTNSAGKIIWQGKVASILGNYVTFTDVLGKLTNKWNSWKTFNKDEILYNVDGNLYRVTSDPSAVISTEPTATTTPSGLIALSSLTLSRASGIGSFTLGVNTSSGNPVQGIKNGQKISGYSIYDCDDINYWKVSGWDEHAQRYATKNQCNITIDTSAPLFDNVNGMLEHFNGILRYTAGKYYLDIEEAEPFILTSDIRTITVDDIIGKIQLSDEGTRSAFNSLTASFADPANKFEPRNISFFNSDYLKADRNVSKKGNLSVPGITNYYNTRTLADSFLNKSRFGLTINMTVRPSGFLLLAGTVIQVVYPKYDWVSPGKKFRIESINYQPDGLVDVVAKEYDDSFYIGTNIRRVAGTGATTVPTTTTPGNPTGLIVTSADTQDELKNGVELFWDNNPVVNQSANASTEIYGSLSPRLFVTVTSITSNTLTTSTVHGLIPGMPVYLVDNYTVSGTTQLDSNDVYYVLTVPTTTSFTLTSNKTGANPTAVPLTNGTALNLRIRTATLLGAVPTPVRSFIDSMPNAGTGRVEKYYWVRHRINRA
jgi:hypothetical protein